MYYTSNTRRDVATNPPSHREAASPVTLRLDEPSRALLEKLSQGSSASSVLREGLHTLGRLRSDTSSALYPMDVDDPKVAAVIAEAAGAAVKVLDGLFQSQRPEVTGIGSNFVGLLEMHLRAMLLGREAAHRTVSTPLNPLLCDHLVFGRVREAGRDEGYCLATVPSTLGEEPLFFNSERNRFMELQRIEVGGLFTSAAEATKAGLKWLQDEEYSPRSRPMRLCILGWDDSEHGIFLREMAS